MYVPVGLLLLPAPGHSLQPLQPAAVSDVCINPAVHADFLLQ
jgi:hypothetical protein